MTLLSSAGTVVSDELLEACTARAAIYERENGFCTEDFEALRDAGTLMPSGDFAARVVFGAVAAATARIYDSMVQACHRAGLHVSLESEARGWVIRVRDPSGAQSCHTLVGHLDNLDAGAVNILLYLKPLLTLEPAARCRR